MTKHNGPFFDLDAQEADDRLIAAAPDLLSALKGIMAQVDGFASNWDELPEGCAAIESAHTAIAKAEGK